MLFGFTVGAQILMGNINNGEMVGYAANDIYASYNTGKGGGEKDKDLLEIEVFLLFIS